MHQVQSFATPLTSASIALKPGGFASHPLGWYALSVLKGQFILASNAIMAYTYLCVKKKARW